MAYAYKWRRTLKGLTVSRQEIQYLKFFRPIHAHWLAETVQKGKKIRYLFELGRVFRILFQRYSFNFFVPFLERKEGTLPSFLLRTQNTTRTIHYTRTILIWINNRFYIIIMICMYTHAIDNWEQIEYRYVYLTYT